MSDDTQGGPYFFLSYAHTPKHDPNDPYDPDQWVETLFTDLCRHVMVMSGLGHGAKPGFMDRDMHSGSYWPERLAESIATCKVFVPLYSRRYFDSDQCGKEWTAFSQRILQQRARGGDNAEAIVPAIWVPVPTDTLPEVAQDIHYSQPGLGPQYVEHGFYGIMKLRQFRYDYQTAVYTLARRIVEVGQAVNLPTVDPADYKSLESAFGPQDARRPNGHRLKVTIVAPDIDTLPKDRDPYHYGRSPQEWNPYRPTLNRPLGAHTADLVRHLGFRPEIGSLDDHYDHVLSDKAPTSAGLLLLDAWATTYSKFAEPLRRFDEAGKPWITVMVPWNRDTQTVEAESRLRGRLEAALPHKLTEGRPTQRALTDGMATFDQFCKAVPEMARSAMNQYLRHAPAHPPKGHASIERPRLQGPLSGGNDAEAPP
ncbi:TIR-like protein FxsC [Sphaerisporangium sp. NBC_01403]|uniref:TIR-like protein FxsC n=1 Tax=Sphaerisporangium sp. NBC_01403 TaxID=2903599 RepID=UPI0032562C6E